MSKQTSTPKKPRKEPISWRVVDFLEANPAEELTRHDIAEKFDIDPVQVDDALRHVVSTGHIVRELNSESVSVWRLNFSKRGVPKPFAISLADAKKARRASRKPPVVIDFTLLVVESGIPVVDNRPGKGSAWPELFGRMKPGDSVLFPLEAKDAASHAQYAYRKDHPGVLFTVRKCGPEHCRVWRTA